MDAVELLERVEEWPVDKLRDVLDRCHPEDYQLIDVRQPQQFEAKHLPGALCLPADELPTRLDELNTEKTTILYCDQGALSNAAAQVLVKSGFADVHVLHGGLQAWQYGFSTGLPHRLYTPLVNAATPQDQAALAWSLEEAAQRFYQALAERLDEPSLVTLFTDLAEAEAHHKTTLEALWEALAGRPLEADFAVSPLSEKGIMEGGTTVDEALQWAAQSSTASILNFAMAMELSAYDHYLTLQRAADNPDSQRLFEVMADEERHHLRQLGLALEKIRP